MLTQTDTLAQYIDYLEILYQQPDINTETIMYHHFIYGLKLHLKKSLVLRQPDVFNLTVSYGKLKESLSSQSSYDEILKKFIQKELQGHQNNQSNSQMNNISQEKVRLKTEIKSLKQGKNSNNIFRTTMEHGRWAITANKTEEAKINRGTHLNMDTSSIPICKDHPVQHTVINTNQIEEVNNQ